jgi:DNA-binding NtrC family response regulator
MKPNILIVDDEIDMVRLLERAIGGELDCHIKTAMSGEDAYRVFEKETFDLALVDIRMPGMGGIELLERMKQVDPWLTVVIVTAHGIIGLAVECIKKGAYDFITKPFDHDELMRLLKKALERNRLLRENLNLRQRVESHEKFHGLVGTSPGIQKVYDLIQTASKTDLTVLITGESGTGKNLAAKAIHTLSSRSEKALVRVHCPTVPENILESELFGYKKGAFTHATEDRKGLFQEAAGGTIYLDEIGDISLAMQTKLLQALEDKEIKPLGQTKTYPVDIRIIASTNADLKTKMESHEFRPDLFYRLNVVNIEMPTLRERGEDIPLLAEHFLERFCSELNKEGKRISPALMRLFLEREWEGNVRELENTIKRAVAMSPGEEIQIGDTGWSLPVHAKAFDPGEYTNVPYREAKAAILKKFNVDYITQALRETSGNVTRAAKLCSLERQSLQQIMKRYDIKSIDFK